MSQIQSIGVGSPSFAATPAIKPQLHASDSLGAARQGVQTAQVSAGSMSASQSISMSSSSSSLSVQAQQSQQEMAMLVMMLAYFLLTGEQEQQNENSALSLMMGMMMMSMMSSSQSSLGYHESYSSLKFTSSNSLDVSSVQASSYATGGGDSLTGHSVGKALDVSA